MYSKFEKNKIKKKHLYEISENLTNLINVWAYSHT